LRVGLGRVRMRARVCMCAHVQLCPSESCWVSACSVLIVYLSISPLLSMLLSVARGTCCLQVLAYATWMLASSFRLGQVGDLKALVRLLICLFLSARSHAVDKGAVEHRCLGLPSPPLPSLARQVDPGTCPQGTSSWTAPEAPYVSRTTASRPGPSL